MVGEKREHGKSKRVQRESIRRAEVWEKAEWAGRGKRRWYGGGRWQVASSSHPVPSKVVVERRRKQKAVVGRDWIELPGLVYYPIDY